MKKRWRKNNPPHCQWILQERLQLLEKMGSKRLRKVKGGRAAAKAASTALEGDCSSYISSSWIHPLLCCQILPPPLPLCRYRPEGGYGSEGGCIHEEEM